MLFVVRMLIGLMVMLAGVQATAADKFKFHKVEAQAGDGVYSLLRRFELVSYSCNFTQFYKLNNLERNAPLVRGQTYQVPIMVYTFDGRSIRTTIGIEDWDQAVRIRDYNRALEETGIRPAPYEKNNVLWVPFHEMNCPKSDLDIEEPKEIVKTDPGEETEKALNVSIIEPQPAKISGNLATSSVKNRTFPIFGAKYAYTPLASEKLKGKVYYIASGHGGPDPGAIGKRGNYRLCEDEYAYDVALRLCRNLIAHGATAYMITRDPNDGIRSEQFLSCDNDEVLWGNVKMSRAHKPRLFQRSDIVNTLFETNKSKGVADGNQTLIAIHVDSRTKREQIDLFFYYHKTQPSGKSLAQQLHRTIDSKYQKYRKSGEYHGTISSRDLHMLREVKPTAVYIELGNIFHNRDQQRIILESNRQYLADWLFEGLMQ